MRNKEKGEEKEEEKDGKRIWDQTKERFTWLISLGSSS